MTNGAKRRAKLKLNAEVFDPVTKAMGAVNDSERARLLGFHRTTIARLRAGSVEPSADVMYEMTKLLGVSPVVLFTRETEGV